MQPWKAPDYQAPPPPRHSPPPPHLRPPHEMIAEGVEHLSAQLDEIREIIVQLVDCNEKAAKT